MKSTQPLYKDIKLAFQFHFDVLFDGPIMFTCFVLNTFALTISRAVTDDKSLEGMSGSVAVVAWLRTDSVLRTTVRWVTTTLPGVMGCLMTIHYHPGDLHDL